MAIEAPAGMTGVTPQHVSDLAASLRGLVIQPGSPEYDDARHIQNGLIDRHPAVIVRCLGTSDVVEAVNFARDHGLHLSVRGGGHNVTGNAMNDGGVVIDLTGMRAVHVDPVEQIVRAEGGATWGDVDRETQLFGLAVPGGVVSTTGIGGLTLHGGLGHLRRKHGLSIDNVLEVEIVTADGRVLKANEELNGDLFWAIRGAGSNFGVVTQFSYRAHQAGPMINLTAPVYSLDDGEQALSGWREYVSSAPDEVSSIALFWSVPEAESFPAEHHRKPIFIPAAVYAGDPAEGAVVTQPLRELAEPLFDLSGTLPYTHLQTAFDPFFPRGRLYYWKSMYIGEMGDLAIETIVNRARQRPSNLSSVGFWHLGGAISRVGPDATAYRRRDAPYLFTAEASWDERDRIDENIAWARDTLGALQEFTRGGLYLNFAGFGEEKEMMLKATYGPNFDRLVEIKRRYDPGNVFHMNANIAPSTSER